ncbi:LamG-like jellyroll fold domain-containing protein [Planctomycetota bacterium]
MSGRLLAVIVLVLTLLAASAPAYAATLFQEDFEGLSTAHAPSVLTGGDLVGQNSWINWNGLPTARNDQDGGLNGSNGPYTFNTNGWLGNAQALVPAEVPRNGTVEIISLINVSNDGYAYGALALSASDSFAQDTLRAVVYSTHNEQALELQLFIGGVKYQNRMINLGFGSTQWIQGKLSVRLDADIVTSATFSFRDVNDTTGTPLAGYTDYAFNFQGNTPTFGISHAGFAVGRSNASNDQTGRLDNFDVVANYDPAQAPVLAAIGTQQVTPGVSFAINLSATDSNAGDSLSFSGAGLPGFCTLNDFGDGTASLSGTSSAGDIGAYAITVTVTDDSTDTLSDEETFTLIVAPPHNAFELRRTFEKETPATGDRLGISVALAGGHALVGAYQDDAGAVDAGAAYLFDKATGALLQTFQKQTPAFEDFFGYSVALAEGQALISAHCDDTGANQAGAAYLFDTETGTLLHTFQKQTQVAEDFFGYSVALGGGRALIGAPYDNTGASDTGAAYLFDTETGAPLRTFLNPTPEAGDYFGDSVALAGGRALIGAYPDNTGGNDAGAAYLFDTETGALLQTFQKPIPVAGDCLGISVALAGGHALIGAHRDGTGGTDAGAAYLFDTETGALLRTFQKQPPAASDFFGRVVALAGGHALVGAYGDDLGTVDAGAAYLFDTDTGALLQTFQNPTPFPLDEFGRSVALAGGQALIGAPRDDAGGVDAGAAHLYSDPAMPATVGSLNPVGYWRLTEPSGTSAWDESGNDHHGTYEGDVTLDQAGAFMDPDSAVLFGGTNGRVNLVDEAIAASGNSARTLIAWVKTTSTDPEAVLATGSPVASQAFNLVIGYGGNPGLFGVMGHTTNHFPGSGIAVSDDHWHMLAAVFDGGSTLRTYVDSSLDNEFTATFNTQGQQNYIGQSNDVGGNERYFNGLIDEAVIYDRALSQLELNALYDVGPNTVPAAPPIPEPSALLLALLAGLLGWFWLRRRPS